MQPGRTSILRDLGDLYGPGTVIIDGDWREVPEPHPPWRSALGAASAFAAKTCEMAFITLFCTIFVAGWLSSVVLFWQLLTI